MESGNFEILPEPFTPREVLLNGSNLLALKARDNGIELVTRVPENLPQMIGDPRAFKQIVLNLVSNAIKFTERGGRVTISARVEGSRMALRVMDNGVGIAQEDLKRIGDPFFQAGKTYQRRQEGTGTWVVDRQEFRCVASGRDRRAEQGRRGDHGNRHVAADTRARRGVVIE